jgi:FkbM family methyltransferase
VRLLTFLAASVLLVTTLAVLARSPRVVEIREQYAFNRVCCDLSWRQAVSLTWEEAIGGATYPSEIGQDKWVLVKMFPGVTDGFFLDVGSGHGTIGSNTKALEERGWTGICVDPFPVQMQGRTCRMVREVVSSVAGQTVKFHTHAGLGGIADTLGKWKEEAVKAPAVDLSTTTLADLLAEAGAPPFIHFLSLDIEGAELEALRGLPFDRYRFGAMAIEHNDEEPRRTDTLAFLAARGYHRTHAFRQDDYYAPR